jgi:hypothetical protein
MTSPLFIDAVSTLGSSSSVLLALVAAHHRLERRLYPDDITSSPSPASAAGAETLPPATFATITEHVFTKF